MIHDTGRHRTLRSRRRVRSAEFFAVAGDANLAWVDALYEHVLGRPADAAGEAYWVVQLQHGESMFAVAHVFAVSRESETRRITDDYLHYLARDPDQQGLTYWTSQLDGGPPMKG